MKDDINGWHYMQPNWRGHTFVRGPFSVGELLGLLEKGEISGKTRVRCDSTSFWQPLDDVLPMITILAKRTEPKTAHVTFLTFRKGHKVALFIALAIIGCIIVGRHVSDGRSVSSPLKVITETYHAPNSERGYPGRETLSKEAVATLTNRERTSNGLTNLIENQLLHSIAEERARDMLEKDYFGHVSPTGEQASDVAQRIGYRYKIIAENIASGMFLTNQKIVDGWMQSPGHRKNILSPEVKELGVSVMKGRMGEKETTVAVQIFGLQSPVVSTKLCIPPSQRLMNEIEVKKAELRGLNERLDTLRKEMDSEKTVIELDQMLVKKDSKKNHDLNVKIKTYNEKSRWHNESLAEIKAKQAVLNSLIEEYNRTVQSYKDYQTSS
jgi:uncharacterized protein YkwD